MELKSIPYKHKILINSPTFYLLEIGKLADCFHNNRLSKAIKIASLQYRFQTSLKLVVFLQIHFDYFCFLQTTSSN